MPHQGEGVNEEDTFGGERAMESIRSLQDKTRFVQRTGVLQKEMRAVASNIAKETPNAVSASLLNTLTKAFKSSVSQRKAFDSRIPNSIAQLLGISAILVMIATGLHLGFRGKRLIVMTSLLVFLLLGIRGNSRFLSALPRSHFGHS